MKLNKTKFKQAQELRQTLMELFPKAFFKRGCELPLKIGIFNDLILTENFKMDPEHNRLKEILFVYTRSLSYKVSLSKPGANRVDLAGNIVEPVEPVEPVAPVHQQYAAAGVKIIKNHRAKQQKLKMQLII